jgi:hypothetical protein
MASQQQENIAFESITNKAKRNKINGTDRGTNTCGGLWIRLSGFESLPPSLLKSIIYGHNARQLKISGITMASQQQEK